MQHLPAVAISSTVLSWLLLGYGKELPLAVGGTFFAWLYLRFLRIDPDTGVIGDPRDEFAFAMLFPPFLQYVSLTLMF